MVDPDHLSVTPSDVLYSADYLDVVGHRATTARRCLAAELRGNASAWQDRGVAGFDGFVGVIEDRAERLNAEVGDVASKLRDAAHTSLANEHRSTGNRRYRPTDM